MVIVPRHIRAIVNHDGAVILDISADRFFSLDPIGAYIWKRLFEGDPLDRIASGLATETGVDVAVALVDVQEFFTELSNKHLFIVGSEEWANTPRSTTR
jgi:hypothetical protein